MNSKLYKLIFCHRLGCLIAVGEFTRSYGRTLSLKSRKSGNNHVQLVGILSRLAMMTGLALGTFPLMIQANPALPVEGQVVAGQGRLNQQNYSLTVTQQTDKLAINWASFDIAHGHSVIYDQPSSQSIVLNRVQGQSASQIYGRLQANGQVFLLNPRGILFGQGAKVNVGGLVASTKNMSNPDFLSGDYRLTGGEREGNIINQANLRSAPGGYIALVGNRIDNQRSGSIITPQGKTVLAVGQNVTLNVDSGNLLGVQVQGEAVTALIQNGGLIQADGGVIQLTARGKDMLMDTVIDNTGILQAKGLSAKNGVIHLEGGDDGAVSQMGIIDVSHQQGKGGRVIVEGKHIHLVKNSHINAQGTEGGGTVLVGGDWQGKNKQIRNATVVVMEKGSSIDVSASRNGQGGTAVLWSRDYTFFLGNIQARGGSQSGDGGLVETSSKRNLQAFGQVDASAARGSAGYWLLDPAEVTIVGSGAESVAMTDVSHISNTQVFTPMTDNAQILNTSINSQLNSGTNVTITTSNASLVGCQWCNITVQADITKTAGADTTLTLHADGNVVVNNNITSDVGKLNLNLLSGNTTADSSITLNNSQILLNGGDLVAKHANDDNTARISIQGGRYDVGNLTLYGNSTLASQVGVNISNSANISVAGETFISGVSSNSRGQGWRGIDMSNNSTLTSVGNITFSMNSSSNVSWMGAFTNATITSDKSITFQGVGNAAGGIDIANGNITSKSGNILFDVNGNISIQSSNGLRVNNSQINAKDVKFEVNVTGVDGFLLKDSAVTATAGNITANVTTTNKGIWIKSNSTLNAKNDIELTAITQGVDEAIIVQGASETLRNNFIAQGNVTLKGNNSSGAGQKSSVNLVNVSLTSTEKNIDISGTSSGMGDVSFTSVELNATAGNATVYAETKTALSSSLNSAFSLSGNNTINAKNGSLTGKAFNTTQGSGIGFHANSRLSINGNIAFQGETEGTGATRKGVDFYGENTLNIAKGSQLSLMGESKGSQDTAGGNGITYSNPAKLTVNNNGSLIMEGRSTSGSGINVPDSNNTLVFNGDGDSVIKGSSASGTGVAISGVINNSTGSVTIEGTSSDGIGVHLFSAEHRVDRINVTGSSTHAEGLRISGNATLADTTLTGNSINGSGVKIDSLPGSSAVTHVVLDNTTLNGSSRNGKAVEITQDVNGIHHSTINGTTDGMGYGIDISENINVTGTSQADLLILNGVATTSSGTGIKLNGNNDLSNTSLNGLAVNGVALDITGPLVNQGNVILNGTASGSGIGVMVNGSLSNNGSLSGSVVNGTSASGVGVQLNGTLENSRINGVSASGSGVKIDGESVLSNTALVGNSTEGKGIEISAHLTGSKGSSVQGNVVNGTGVVINKDIALNGGSADDLLAVSGIASNEKGIGITLGGNNTLNNISLNGKAIGDHGVEINGLLINNGNTSINGKTSGDGRGVYINGAVSGGEINGHSENNHGVFLDKNGLLNEIALGGGTGLYRPSIFIALPESIGNNVTIHGKPVDKTQIEDNKVRENNVPITVGVMPLLAVIDPVAAPVLIHGESTTKQTSTLTRSEQIQIEEPGMLITARNHILSTLEGRDLSSSVVTESGRSAVRMTSIRVCVPLNEASENGPCDEYIFNKGQPHFSMIIKK